MSMILHQLIGIACAMSFETAVQRDDVPTKPVDGQIQWAYSYEEGKQKAKDSGKPMFVVFRCER